MAPWRSYEEIIKENIERERKAADDLRFISNVLFVCAAVVLLAAFF